LGYFRGIRGVGTTIKEITAMVYVVGIVGFIGGFCAGLLILLFLLRHKTAEQLTTDPTLKVYGFLNWVVAGVGAAAFVAIYRNYFG